MCSINDICLIKSNRVVVSGTLTAWPMMMTLKTWTRRFLHTGEVRIHDMNMIQVKLGYMIDTGKVRIYDMMAMMMVVGTIYIQMHIF